MNMFALHRTQSMIKPNGPSTLENADQWNFAGALEHLGRVLN